MKWEDLIRLGFRNLTNRRSRSVMTIGGVAVGIMAIIFLVSVGYGVQELAIRETTESKSLSFFDVTIGTGEIRKLDQSVLLKLKGINDVVEVYPQLETPAKVSILDSETKIDLITFINDIRYVEQTDIRLSAGKNFSDDKAEIIISRAALELMGIEPSSALGSKIELTPLFREGFVSAQAPKELGVEFTIVGIIDDGDNPYASSPVRPYEMAYGEMAFSAAKIEVSSSDKVENVRLVVSDMGLETDYLGDIVSQLEGIFTVARIIMAGFGLIATFVAALGMFNTMSVSLLERTREIGIMKTLGTKRRDVWKLFLVEGMLISVAGGVLGILAGIAFGQGLNAIVNMLARSTDNPTVYFYYTPLAFIAVIMGLVILLGAAVGLLPARRATKISPLEALRYE